MPLPEQRITAIRERLERDGQVLAADLARDFATSEDTIRRDLRDLAAAGLCRRVYGGALPVSPAGGSLRERSGRNEDEKLALGRAAAAMVRPGQFICLDAGSTNLAIARALPGDRPLMVATNAPAIAVALEDKPGVEVLLLGGRLDRRSGAALGARAMRDFAALRFDLYFVGACAADPARGLAVFDPEEAEWKRAAVAASAAVATAITAEKVGTTAPCIVAAPDEGGHIVVASAALAARWGGSGGPRLHVAGEARR